MQVFKIDLDFNDIEGAVTASNSLNESLDNLNTSSKDLSKNFISTGGILTNIFEKIEKTTEKINKTFSSIGEGLTKIVGKAKTLALSLMGIATSALFSASGTNREMGQGGMAKIGWAGQRAYESATDLTGFNADFMATQKAINEGYLQGNFAPLGMGADEVSKLQKMSGDKAYFSMVDKFTEKLEGLIKEHGEFQGKNVFGQIYGESLQNILGLGSTEFINNLQSGNIGRFKGSYYDTLSTYQDVDTKSLMEGEKAFNKFMNTLKSATLSLSSHVLPGITKGIKSIQGVFSSFNKWLNTSDTAKGLSKLFENLINLLTKLFGKVSEFISSLDVGKNFEGVLDGANKAIEALNKGDTNTALKEGAKTFAKTASGVSKTIYKAVDSIADSFDSRTPEQKQESKQKLNKAFDDTFKSIDNWLKGMFGGEEPKIKAQVDNRLTIDIKTNGTKNQTVSLIGNAGKNVTINTGAN